MPEKQAMTVQKIDEWRWRLPREGKMRTDGIVFAAPAMMDDIRKDESLSQVANVAWLPGIVGHSLAMPDIHWGYGFPIGGVAAFSLEEGVISPGGVGFDINCGVRLFTTPIEFKDITGRRDLIDNLFNAVPTGVGAKSPLKVSQKSLDGMMTKGAR